MILNNLIKKKNEGVLMKRQDNFAVVCILLGIFLLFPMLWVNAAPPAGKAEDQEQEHERIREEVSVTNVQVPVRVLYKGQPVTDLKVEDFTLYEDKKPVKINGFFLKRKTLSLSTEGQAEAVAEPEPRTFVLVFNVSNYNSYFEKGLDYLFDKVFLPTDRLLLFANNKTRDFKIGQNKDAIKSQLIKDLKEEGSEARRRLISYVKQVETMLNVHDFTRSLSRRDNERPRRAIEFLKKYLLTWKEFQQRYLAPRTDRFYYFSRFLEKVQGQKWVLNFYQFEFFPRIRPNSRALETLRDLSTELSQSPNATAAAQGRNLETVLSQVNTATTLSNKFPVDELTKLFYKVDATFHSFFIRSTNADLLNDVDYDQVSSDLELLLKGITDLTGGKNMSTNDLAKGLETVTQTEDAYYMLTYVPKNPKRAGKLSIKVKGKKYKVLYDDNFRADYINAYFNKLEQKIQTPDVKVKDFSFKNKILAFTVADFMMRKIEGKNVGHLKIRIRLTDNNNKSLFDSAKTLEAQKNEMKISLPVFKSIKKGEYNILIDAQDLMTGKEDNFFQDIIVKR
jgi:hypothetical protein